MRTEIKTSISEAGKRWTVETSGTTDPVLRTRHELGQFLTPKHIADFMAGLFHARCAKLDLLDAGAGDGALTAALVRRLRAVPCKPKIIAVTAYEVDGSLIEPLRQTLEQCQAECESGGIEFSSVIINDDFITSVVPMLRADLFSSQIPHFNAAIVNPPYRKLRSDSGARRLLRSIGIETSNFYSAFVALIIRLLTHGGELVAITPRSFCNGPYFKPFRVELLNAISVERLHLFESRSAAFGKDNVLQENIIVHGVKDQQQSDNVIVSSSSGRQNSAITERRVPYSDVVLPTDPERFIHVGIAEPQSGPGRTLSRFEGTLDDLDLAVSTGRVVDFRAKAFLRKYPNADTVPLIYPGHFNGNSIVWPKKDSRKPNAILVHHRTRDLLVPSEVYVLVKRFTSKEERRRIVACIYDPKQITAQWVGFENHLNYFHVRGRGMPITLARGLAAFLNSTFVDSYFRQFSGHTQVNATDLRKLNYPSAEALKRLGGKIRYPLNQGELDDLIERELSNANQEARRAGIGSQA
jgi:adenine-specific DNA-methyltransferase